MINNYYLKNKEKLQKDARERYQNTSEKEKEEKEKKPKDARERYRNVSEEGKEKNRQYYREGYKNLLKDGYRKHFSRMQEIKTI